MKVSCGKPLLLLIAVAASALLAGCPLPFEYNGTGATNAHTSDPSSPNMTSPVTVSYSVQGGASGTIANEGSFVSGQTTTVTLSTASLNAVIFYTDDGTSLTDLRSANKINASSGTFTITRTTSLQSMDIHAVAVGPNMLPSPAVHVTVAVSPFPILSVTRNNASISENGGTATFTISSSSPPAGDISVTLLTGGTYGSGDVTGIPVSGTTFTATLLQSTTTVTLSITGVHNSVNADHTVILTIQPDPANPAAYTVGTPSSASVTIQDDLAHTVTYNGNGNTGGTAPTDGNGYLSGATVTVAGPGTLARSGFTFAGWNTAPDGTGTGHGAGTSMTMGSADVTLYAMWTPLPTYSVTYAGNGSTGGTAPTDGTSNHAGDPVTVLGPGSLTNSAGFFAGWNTASNGSGTTYSAGSSFAMGSGNVTLYAMWIAVSGGVITPVPNNVTDVVIPEGVTDFGTAFRNHTSLTSVTIPSTITGIFVQAFIGCSQLTTIVSNNARYQVINGALVDTVNGVLMLVPSKLSGAFTIPAVTSIDPYAFDQCTNLTSISFPASLTTISGNGFSGLRSAIPVIIPSTVTSIGGYGFYNSYVTSITVPTSVTSIGISAMGLCPNLGNVYMQSGTPPTLGTTAFAAPVPTIHVPTPAAVTAYQSAANWSAYAAYIVTP